MDDATTRLVGTTSNPTWYAGQVAALPFGYCFVAGVELQDAARRLGQQLLAASGQVATT